MNQPYPIPVLFCFFNRPIIAKRTFEEIRKCKPPKLYLASDGPRQSHNESSIVSNLRDDIIASIDWECEVKTLFRNENLGCSLGIKTAVDWLFENENCGIILEDDCVVQSSFWEYMQATLLRYENDSRIGMIAGYNHLNSIFNEDSYAFSSYKACWGWATWRRAWENMDLEMKWRTTHQYNDIMMRTGLYGKDIRETEFKLMKIDENLVSAWDWQWYSSLASQNQLCIFPAVNLVTNIGFGEGATHTKNKSESTDASQNLTFPLKHPNYIVPNYLFDKKFHYNLYNWKRIIRNFLIPMFLYKHIFKKGK